MRRVALPLLALVGCAAALAPGARAAPPTPAAERSTSPPNIVLLVTDDQRPATFRPRILPTAFELIGDGRGTLLERMVLSTPLCCPYRASLLSGQYGHNNGVLANIPGYDRLRGKRNVLPVWLQRAGYRTAHFGKFLNGYGKGRRTGRVPPGWSYWRSSFSTRYYGYTEWINGAARERGEAAEEHYTRLLGEAAAAWAGRTARGDKPFYLQIDHLAPHFEVGARSPGECGGLAIPEPRDEALLGEAPPPAGPSFNEADVADKPEFIRTLPPLAGARLERAERARRCERAALAGFDRAIGELRSALRAAGALERTAILITTDNGFLVGEHRVFGEKILPYRETSEVPLLARLPRRLRRESVPARSAVPAAGVDLTATVLELAGADPCRAGSTRVGGRQRLRCRTLDGRSLLPALRGWRSGIPPRRPVPLEFDAGVTRRPGTCGFFGVWRESSIWVRHTSAATIADRACRPVREIEHYELGRDPGQLHNLAAPGEYGDGGAGDTKRGRLARLARELQRCAGIRGRDSRQAGKPFCR